jgi:uncharacterized protein YcfJ
MKKIVTILAIASFALQANAFTITEKARVIQSKPVYKTVIKRVPYQECWNEEVPVRRNSSHYNNSQNPLGLIIGGIAGGVIGHQVGKGRGKDIATVGGALIGTMVGHNLSRRGQNRNSYVTYETRQRCTTSYHESTEERFIGYKNIAKYKGRRIVKISPRKLRYIPIDITMRY